MNSFLLLLDFYFFVSVRLCSRIGDASYNANRVPTNYFQIFLSFLTNCPLFGDKMAGCLTKFLPSFDPYRGLWQPKCPLSTELLSLSGHCDACYGSGHRHDSRIAPAGATAR